MFTGMPVWSLFYPCVVGIGAVLVKAGVSLSSLNTYIVGLAVLYGVGLFIGAKRRSQFELSRSLGINSAFFCSQFLLFFLLGPYLEIPSDPVGVHLFRISEWLFHPENIFSPLRWGKEGSTSYNGYLWSAAFLAPGKFADVEGLRLLAAVNCTILAMCLYRWILAISDNYIVGILGVLFTEITLGTAGHSYFRYYALAPGLLNLAVLFDLMAVLVRERRGILVDGILILFSAVLFYLTHHQEILFLGMATVALMAARYSKIQGILWTKRAAIGLLLLTCIFYGIAFLRNGVPGKFTETISFWGPLFLANPFSERIQGTVNTALKFALLVALGLSFHYRKILIGLQRKKESIFLVALCLSPFVLLFVPPVSFMVARVLSGPTYFRLFYFSPLALLPIYLIFLLWDQVTFKERAVFTLLLLVIFSLSFRKKSAGSHFFYYSNPKEELNPWPELTASVGSLSLPKNTILVTDALTSYPMMYLEGLYTPSCHTWRCTFPMEYVLPASFWHFTLNAEHPLLVINEEVHFSKSRFTGHWPEDVRNLKYYTHSEEKNWIQTLLQSGDLVLQERVVGKFSIYEFTKYKQWDALCHSPGVKRERFRSCEKIR